MSNLAALTPNDHKHGHRRTFSRSTVLAEIRKAGLKPERISGVILKILADFQLNALLKQQFLGAEHFKALQSLASQARLGVFADSFFVVVRK